LLFCTFLLLLKLIAFSSYFYISYSSPSWSQPTLR
jgi:hypothetical protein